MVKVPILKRERQSKKVQFFTYKELIMSEIKDNAKKLCQKAKEFGYDIKHTHALELVSQITRGVNRHVGLKEEKKEESLSKEEMEEMFFYGRGEDSFRLDKFEKALRIPFFEAHVLMIGAKHSEEFEIVVSDDLSTALDLLQGEIDVDWIQVLSPKDLEKEVRQFNEDEPEKEVVKTIYNWIMDKHNKTGETYFTVFMD